MRDELERSLDLLLAGFCGVALYVFPDPTVRGAVLIAGLCVFALRSPCVATSTPLVPRATPEPPPPAPKVAQPQGVAESTPGLVSQMIERGRTALLLRSGVCENLAEEERSRAIAAVDESAALVPAGPVVITPRGLESDCVEHERLIQVNAFLLDRYPVTNRAYQAFVDDGGYQQMSLWDAAIWPAVLQFVDQTGEAGPRAWRHGRHLAEQGNHPVTGVSWFEATAYARWAGKRLPTDAEWVKATAWPICPTGERPTQRRYPWGDAMDRRVANLWNGEPTGTTAVDAFPGGGAVNGVYDLVGNVWEWTASSFDEYAPQKLQWEAAAALKSIRGGAFDTYFDTQAATDFASGEDPLSRRPNIGFRCALSPTALAALSSESNA